MTTATHLVINRKNTFIPHNLGKIQVSYNGKNYFAISSSGDKTPILYTQKELQGITQENLQKALKVGKLNLAKIGDNYKLTLHVDGKGGGPITAFCVYISANLTAGGLMLLGAVTKDPTIISIGKITYESIPIITAYAASLPNP